MKHTMSGRIVAGAFSLVLATACTTTGPTDPGPGKRVQVTLAQQSYQAGQSVKLVIKNLSDLRLQYPYRFCKMELQREDTSGWLTVFSPDGCALALGNLDPGQSVSEVFRIPTDVPEGIFRLTMPMPWLPNATTVEPRLTTTAFQITSGN